MLLFPGDRGLPAPGTAGSWLALARGGLARPLAAPLELAAVLGPAAALAAAAGPAAGTLEARRPPSWEPLEEGRARPTGWAQCCAQVAAEEACAAALREAMSTGMRQRGQAFFCFTHQPTQHGWKTCLQ